MEHFDSFFFSPKRKGNTKFISKLTNHRQPKKKIFRFPESVNRLGNIGMSRCVFSLLYKNSKNSLTWTSRQPFVQTKFSPVGIKHARLFILANNFTHISFVQRFKNLKRGKKLELVGVKIN